MLKKRLGAMLLVLVIAVSVVPLYAAAGTESADMMSNIIGTRSTNINNFINSFDINSSGKATVLSNITARNVDECRITASLQRYSGGSWTEIKSWSTTSYATYAALNEQWYVLSGYQYRVVCDGSVYSGGTLLESASYTSSTVTY